VPEVQAEQVLAAPEVDTADAYVPAAQIEHAGGTAPSLE